MKQFSSCIGILIIIAFKVTAVFSEWVDFAYLWCWICEGLCLQPAPQDCLSCKTLDFQYYDQLSRLFCLFPFVFYSWFGLNCKSLTWRQLWITTTPKEFISCLHVHTSYTLPPLSKWPECISQYTSPALPHFLHSITPSLNGQNEFLRVFFFYSVPVLCWCIS